MPPATMRREEAWRVLGLAAQPSVRDVKLAFRRLAKSTHPDLIGGGRTPAQFARLTEAYEVALADAVAAGRLGTPRREMPPARPTPVMRQSEQAPRQATASEAIPRARPGSTTYDGATEEEPFWNGAAWVGADSGTYWTVNPREYADPRKHGPEYRARGRRPVRRTPRERMTSEPVTEEVPTAVATSGSVTRSTSLMVGAVSLALIAVLVSGSLRLVAAGVLCALLAFAVLRGRHR